MNREDERRLDRPHYATTDAGWLRQLSRAAALVIVVLLVGLLFRAGRSVLEEGERLALGMAEEHLEDLVWLEAKRAMSEEGVEGLRRRAGQDPRGWARDRLASAYAEDRPAGPLPDWADERWSFDADAGELVYRVTWLEGGDWRWRVELLADGPETPEPGLARDLVLVRVSPP